MCEISNNCPHEVEESTVITEAREDKGEGTLRRVAKGDKGRARWEPCALDFCFTEGQIQLTVQQVIQTN